MSSSKILGIVLKNPSEEFLVIEDSILHILHMNDYKLKL